MNQLKLISALLKNDQKLIFRDRFLIYMAIAGLLIAIILRYALPWLNQIMIDQQIMPGSFIDQSLADLYPMLIPFIILYNSGMISSLVVGFLMLDEKDEHTLKVVTITPTSLEFYILYRAGLAFIFSFLLNVASFYIIDLALLPPVPLILFSLGGALFSMQAILFLCLFAQNKVEGFAFAKFLSIGGWVIMLGYFLPEIWQWPLSIFPPFLIHKAYWMALSDADLWGYILTLGIILQLLAISIMTRKFVAHYIK